LQVERIGSDYVSENKQDGINFGIEILPCFRAKIALKQLNEDKLVSCQATKFAQKG